MRTKVEIRVKHLDAKKNPAKVSANHQEQGERPGTESPSNSSERPDPAHTLILDLWPPEL